MHAGIQYRVTSIRIHIKNKNMQKIYSHFYTMFRKSHKKVETYLLHSLIWHLPWYYDVVTTIVGLWTYNICYVHDQPIHVLHQYQCCKCWPPTFHVSDSHIFFTLSTSTVLWTTYYDNPGKCNGQLVQDRAVALFQRTARMVFPLCPKTHKLCSLSTYTILLLRFSRYMDWKWVSICESSV